MKLVFILTILLLNAPVLAQDCGSSAASSGSYDQARINCLGCATVDMDMDAGQALGYCVTLANQWCQKNDPTCSKPSSMCSSRWGQCKKDPDPICPDGKKRDANGKCANDGDGDGDDIVRPDPTPDPVTPQPGPVPNPTPGDRNAVVQCRVQNAGRTVPGQPGKFVNLDELCGPLGPAQPTSAQSVTPETKAKSLSWNKDPMFDNETAVSRAQAAKGGSGFTEPETKGTFKASGLIDTADGRRINAQEIERNFPQGSAPVTKTVPNNSGTSLPSATATNAQNLVGPSAKNKKTKSIAADIMSGPTGGGGFSGYGGGAERGDSTERGSRGGDRFRNREPSGAELPPNLRDFLPGGSMDPRQRAGMGLSGVREIHPSTVNLWDRISHRMVEKCAMGELFQCR